MRLSKSNVAGLSKGYSTSTSGHICKTIRNLPIQANLDKYREFFLTFFRCKKHLCIKNISHFLSHRPGGGWHRGRCDICHTYHRLGIGKVKWWSGWKTENGSLRPWRQDGTHSDGCSRKTRVKKDSIQLQNLRNIEIQNKSQIYDHFDAHCPCVRSYHSRGCSGCWWDSCWGPRRWCGASWHPLVTGLGRSRVVSSA